MVVTEEKVALAIKSLIARLPKGGDPIKYIYEVNQILNRVKSNLYKMMDETQSDVDPAEMISIVIKAGLNIDNFINGTKPNFYHPTTLKIYGFRGYGRLNGGLPEEFAVTLDISDVFDKDSLYKVRMDYFKDDLKGLKNPESYLIENHPFVKSGRHSIYMRTSKNYDGTYLTSLNLAGIIYHEVLEEGRKLLPSLLEGGGRLMAKYGKRFEGDLSKPLTKAVSRSKWVELAIEPGYYLSGFEKGEPIIQLYDDCGKLTLSKNTNFDFMACFIHSTTSLVFGLNKKELHVNILFGSKRMINRFIIPIRTNTPVPDRFKDNQLLFKFIKTQLLSNIVLVLSQEIRRAKAIITACMKLEDQVGAKYYQGNGFKIQVESKGFKVYFNDIFMAETDNLAKLNKNIFI